MTELPICRGDLAQCQKDMAGEREKLKLRDATIKDLQVDRAGGTKKQKFNKWLKCAAVGGATAAVGAAIAKEKGAAIGSIGGSGICAIAF